MMAGEQFCLRWNNHQSTLVSVFDTLLKSGTLVDCTLAAEGQYLKAHKVVLSACSSYLEVLLSQHYDKHPIIILKDVTFQELKAMLDYMYRGEVNISQDQLGTFLKAAESLQLKGLSEGGGGDNDARDVGSTKIPQRLDPPPLPRKLVPAAPTPQPRKTAAHVKPHLSDIRDSSLSSNTNNARKLRPREGSISPSLRKRRRITRSSQGINSNKLTDSQLENDSCDLPSQIHSTPFKVSSIIPCPNIPLSLTPVVPSTNEQSLETDHLNVLEEANLNSSVAASGVIQEKMEPTSEVLLEPKIEYLDEMNNEDSVEDLTLDDDDYGEIDGASMDNNTNAGPSNIGDSSDQQGFRAWQMAADDKLSTDEVFLAAQEAGLSANRKDSQGMFMLSRLPTCDGKTLSACCPGLKYYA